MVTAVFSSSYGDTVRAIRAINRVLPRVRLMRRAGLAFIAIAILSAIAGLGLEWVILFLFVPVILFPILWTGPFYLAWLSWRNSPIANAEQRYVFSDSGVEATGRGARTFMQWSAVTRLEETKDFFIFFTSNQCGYAIPKRAFTDSGAVGEVRTLFQDRCHAVAAPAGGPEKDDLSDAVHTDVLFEHEPKEVYRAVMAASRHGTARWPFYVAMLVLGWWTGGATAYERWRQGGWQAVDWLLTGMAFLPLIIVILATPLASLWIACSHRRANPSASGSHSIRLSDTGLQTSGRLYTGHLGWDALSKVVETPEFFLFYVSKAQAVFLPKRLLDADDRTRIRTLLKQVLGPRARIQGADSA